MPPVTFTLSHGYPNPQAPLANVEAWGTPEQWAFSWVGFAYSPKILPIRERLRTKDFRGWVYRAEESLLKWLDLYKSCRVRVQDFETRRKCEVVTSVLSESFFLFPLPPSFPPISSSPSSLAPSALLSMLRTGVPIRSWYPVPSPCLHVIHKHQVLRADPRYHFKTSHSPVALCWLMDHLSPRSTRN